MALILIPGEKHNKLTAVRAVSVRKQDGRLAALWRCDCGQDRVAPIGRVRTGLIKSCGCDTSQKISEARTVHGGRATPEYSSWRSMKDRCLNPDSKDFERWGGRGITIDAEWIGSFEAFFKHIGPRPEGTTLDRIDNEKGYAPGNVRWAPATTQQTNRQDSWIVEIDGQTFPSMRAAAKAHKVSETTIVRWCEGSLDERRAHHTRHGRSEPKPNCHRWRKYDA